MTDAYRLTVAGRLGTLVFDHPGQRVNVLSRANLARLGELVEELRELPLDGLVLLSGKPGHFCAGFDVADIAAVDDPALAEAVIRQGQAVFAAWESLPFPTFAAIDGICVGGGTEWSLASSRILVSDRPELRIGLPETRLGILPGWGGCVRLPRRVGISDALGMILPGKTVPGHAAFKMGLADALLPAAGFLGHVRELVLATLASGATRVVHRDVRERLLEGNALGRRLVFDQARKKTLEKTGGHYPAPLRAIEVVRIGVEEGPSAGFDAEARAAAELSSGPVCKNLMHVFQLSEDAKRHWRRRGAPVDEQVAVVGAGVMGGAIAQLLAERLDRPVRLVDIDPEALATGVSQAARLLDRRVRRRRLTRSEAQQRLALIRPALGLGDLGRCTVVVEAVFEKLAVKQQLIAELSSRVSSESILASNTSALRLADIADAATHPERVVGMHFFNPVHRTSLVEVVVGPKTSAEHVVRVARLARRLGKTPLEVRDGPGFLINRLLGVGLVEALWLLDQGCGAEEIDRALTDWGLPIGPFALLDEVGFRVALDIVHSLANAYPDRLRLPAWIDDLERLARGGPGDGQRFYRYRDGRRAGANPSLPRELGLGTSRTLDGVTDRVLLPMVDEAARALDEGIVADARQLDLGAVLGAGFPAFRGGICRWADGQRPAALVGELERLAETLEWRAPPSRALRSAIEHGFYATWPSRAGSVPAPRPTGSL